MYRKICFDHEDISKCFTYKTREIKFPMYYVEIKIMNLVGGMITNEWESFCAFAQPMRDGVTL